MCAPASRTASTEKGTSVGIIIAIVVALLIVPIVGILVVLSIYGTRKYIVNSKTAEARQTLGRLAKDVASAYEDAALAQDGHAVRRLCPSASAPVPADRSLVSGRKYMSAASDWQTDASRNAGFACLEFEMNMPQYFQYEYEATETRFVVRAHGDLDGDGVFSTFEIKGQVVGDRLVLSPALTEIDPDE